MKTGFHFFFLASASLCRKQCVDMAWGATSLIPWTTPDCLPVIMASPSVQTPIQLLQFISFDLMKLSNVSKNSVCHHGTQLFTKQKIFFYLISLFITNVCEVPFLMLEDSYIWKAKSLPWSWTESWPFTSSSNIVVMRRLTVLFDNGTLTNCFDLSSTNISLPISVADGKVKVSAIVCPFFALVIFFSNCIQYSCQ